LRQKSLFKNLIEDKIGIHIFSILFAMLYITIIILIVGLMPGADEYLEAEREYEKLRQYAPDDTRLFSINMDYAGWIRINGTNIDYPMVQADNTKYINTTFRGKENPAGAIFIDSRSIGNFDEPLTIIHGNNTERNLMFGSLHEYSSGDYLHQHQNIAVFTPFGDILTYHIFAAFATNLDNQLFTLYDAEEEYIINFFISTGAAPDATHFLVLSTQTTAGSERDRTVVFAAR